MGALEIATESFVSERPYERMDGTAKFGAYLQVSVTGAYSKTVAGTFYARLDTAADISIMPTRMVKRIRKPLYGRPALCVMSDGKVKRRRTHKLRLIVHGDMESKPYYPERGVVLRDAEYGLIGMDIMKHWTVTFDGVRQTFTISI